LVKWLQLDCVLLSTNAKILSFYNKMSRISRKYFFFFIKLSPRQTAGVFKGHELEVPLKTTCWQKLVLQEDQKDLSSEEQECWIKDLIVLFLMFFKCFFLLLLLFFNQISGYTNYSSLWWRSPNMAATGCQSVREGSSVYSLLAELSAYFRNHKEI